MIFVVGALLGTAGFAQETAVYTSNYTEYQHGLKLFRQQQYNAAQRIFERVNQHTDKHTLKANTAYYGAISAVHLDQPDAEKRMRNFVEEYPESPQRNSAYSNVANFYFQEGNYNKARDWYKRVDVDGLSAAERNQYNFNQGYAAFKTDHPEEAKRYFNRVRGDKTYGSQATYYLGYLAYENDNYKEADALFDKVDEADKVDKNVSYFQSNINFKSGKFKEAIASAKEQLPQSNSRERSELNKIIGESYFNLEQYQEAIPYLEKYEGKHGRWNNTDYYQLGYAYYKMGDYKKAISQFNKIIAGQDAVAQNAYYHLAECYINLGQKLQALNAFKNASEMAFDKTITEDAALNYAKLSYDIGNNYKSVPEVLTEFLENYPNSPAKAEIQGLLVNSYLTSNNYKKAMELLENSRSFKDQSVYQKVAFYRGLELYAEGDYQKASTLFQKSIAQRKLPEFTARATYWKAECAYNLGDFKAALIGYKEFEGLPGAKGTPEMRTVDYNIGYAYFNQKKYESAKSHFQTYLDNGYTQPQEKNDAYLRLGDSYFALSDYWSAMEEYNKAIAQKNVDSDYAYYQKAISYGFVKRNQRKIEDLNAFLKRYAKSIYRDDALYQLGNTYLAEGKSQEALQAYDQLITQMPNSVYVAQALSKQGLIYYNNGQNQDALAKFKKVAAQFPNSEEANQAVRSARNIYVDLGQIDDYAAWVKTLDYVNVTNSDIDKATFEVAANQFIDQDKEAAIKSYEKYLKKFPNGSHALSAHYRLGQLYFDKGSYQKAEPHLQFVADQSRNEFTGKALVRLARVYLEEDNAIKAIPVLKRLETEANLQENITFAQSNLMKAYYEQHNYGQTVAYAEKVLANSKAGNRAKSDAHIFIARSAIKTGDEDKAKKAYAEVAKMARGKLAAEAQYYDAYFKRKAKDYKASNESVQVLARDYSGYREFSVKGLLLMGKNFYNLNDAYQATFILQNIIDNFKAYPEVVKQAEQELARIKAEEAKTNASVQAPATPTSEVDTTTSAH